MPRPKTYREFPLQSFLVIRGPSGYGIREIQLTYLFVDGPRIDILAGQNLVKFNDRIRKGMETMDEYMARGPWAIRWSMKDRGDYRVSLIKKIPNWAHTRRGKEPAYQIYASIDSPALNHMINQEFARRGGR